MGKKLTEDEIKWILSVESSEAQQEIHKLTQANKDLAKANKARLEQMIRLESQGKKDTAEWKELDKIIKQNTQSISKNKEMISQLEGKMKITELTMSQLRKKARDLQRQLDDTVKATHPEEWNRLDKDLKTVRTRMDELKGSSKNVGEGLGKIGNTLKAAGIAAVAAIAFKVVSSLFSKMKELTTQSLEMATTADGVVHAFDKLNRPDILDDLREATNNTVNDLTLMKASVKADDLGLSFDDLANYLALAELQADKTGESIDDLMDKLLKGVARQSSKSLINLGISKSEIEEKKKETGDFMSAINAIVKKRLQEQSDDYQTAGDREEQQMIRLQNAQLELGTKLLPLKEKWDKFWTSIQIGGLKAIASMSKLFGVTEKGSSTLDEQVGQYVELNATLTTLSTRYEVLQSKTKLSKVEHEELNGIIKQISSTVPSAITKWDAYGNAISISTNKVYDFLAAEKARLQYINRDEIESSTKELRRIQTKINEQRRLVQSGTRDKVNAAGEIYKYALTPKEMQEAQSELERLGALKLGIETQLNNLRGVGIDKMIENHKLELAAREKFNGMNKGQLTTWLKDEKNAANEYRSIAQDIYNSRFVQSDGGGDKGKKDPYKDRLDALDAKLLKEQVLLKQSKKTKEEVDNELIALEVKYLEKKRDLYKADTVGYNDYQNQLLDIARNKSMTANQASIKSLGDSNKSVTTGINAYETAKKGALLSKFEKNPTPQGQDEYDTAIRALDVELSEWRLQNAKDYADIIRDTEFDSDADKAQAIEAADVAVKAAGDALLNANKAVLKNKADQVKKHEEDVAKIRQDFGLDKEKLSYQEGLAALKAKLKEGLATEQQTADAVAKYKLSKVQEYAEGAAQIVGTLSNLVSSIHESETSSLEAQKQKELSIAGNNADARQEIETRYAQKELDLKKKQADSNMGIAIAQSLAESALGIVKIWAIDGINPILAAALTAGLVAITIANIATATSQRDAIKNTTIAGAETGGYIDVTRAQDGKVYRNAVIDPDKRGYVDRPTILAGEGGPGKSLEWVASNAAMQNPTVASFINILDKHQQAGTIRTLDMNQLIRANMAGYATGGFVNQKSSTTTIFNKSVPVSSDSEYLSRLVMVLEDLSQNGVIAPIVLSELEAKTALRDRARNIGKK